MMKKLAVIACALAGAGFAGVLVVQCLTPSEARQLARARLAVARAAESTADLQRITVDYPSAGAVFPPEIVPPTVLWHDASDEAHHWLMEAALPDAKERVHVLSDGRRPERVIDPETVAPNNVWEEDEYQATAKGWTPDRQTWEVIKRSSVERDLVLNVWGLTAKDEVVSRGSVSFRTSEDPVGAPIFYRDVPLMPEETKDGIVRPLAATGVPLIKWRLRDISKPSAPVVMEHMPTCANCHSFAADGKTLSMDVDGPTGDKGAHTVQAVEKHIVIDNEEVFTWNDFRRDPDVPSFGLFPRVSPDGRYVAATVKESVFVQNYTDFRFLQTFYPTRGIIAIYDRETGKMKSLRGADDTDYVQTNPAWTPDGKHIVFLRAPARDNYPSEERATYANDPLETQIKYDIWKVPFNDGKGGKPSPLPGASANGKSNSFPAFSPNGKWLVFVQCDNGLLMRPDSRLFIVPAEGGEPREMNCNTRLMNSWHSWSPNSRWLVFSSKSRRPFTQMFLTHVDEDGIDTPAVLLPGSTADNRAVNLPEFLNAEVDAIAEITSPAVEYRRLLGQGTELLEASKLTEAHSALKASLECKDDYPESQIVMGFVLNCLGKPEKAVGHFRRALELDPNQAEAHQQWANSLFVRGEIDAAIEHYHAAIEIDARHTLAHGMLATALMKKGRADEALERYAMAVKASPSRARGYRNWAIALMKLGRLREAEQKLRKYVELDPESVDALGLLAQALVKTGKREEAVQHLEKAVVLDPKEEPARRNLARLLAELGRTDEAVRHLRVACELSPTDPLVLNDMGNVLMRLGKPTEAMEYYRRALAAEPGYDPARNSLAWILATHPDPEVRDGKEAIKHAELACRNTRWGSPGLMLTLATAHAETGNFEAAVDAARKALELAEAVGHQQLTVTIREYLKLYEKGVPYVRAGK